MEDNNELIDKMIEKSQESFLLAIELYNKPTIMYRLESFAFFVCNAWELLLKAYLVKNSSKEIIYYKDKNERTISISDCVKKVFTNDKDPIRKNLEIIIDLRNTSTHYIIPELENVYFPFLQANTLNYSQKLFDFFSIDITNKITSTFLALMVNTVESDDTEILSKYGNEIFNKFRKVREEATNLLQSDKNNKLAISVNLNLKIVKDKNKADLTFAIANNADEAVYVLDKVKDININYPYSQKSAREQIMKNLERKNIEIDLHQRNFNLICSKYSLKNNEDYFYFIELTNRYACSQKLIDFITNLILKEPDIIEKIKNEIKK